jgi:hypothetical protein
MVSMMLAFASGPMGTMNFTCRALVIEWQARRRILRVCAFWSDLQ